MNDREWAEYREAQDEAHWAQKRAEDAEEDEARSQGWASSGGGSSGDGAATAAVLGLSLAYLLLLPGMAAVHALVRIARRLAPGWGFLYRRRGAGFKETLLQVALVLAGIVLSLYFLFSLLPPLLRAAERAAGNHGELWRGLCMWGIGLHFVVRLLPGCRNTVWVGAPMLGTFAWAAWSVVDALRSADAKAMLAPALAALVATGLWLLMRPTFALVDDDLRSRAARRPLQDELDAALNALHDDRAQGKDGEARVHAALERELRRLYGSDWALLPAGGLLPIEGRIPFTDIDHIAVTPHGLITIETKDWAWKKILPVAGDDSVVERRRGGERERFKNPLLQAAMKPRHLRRALRLEAAVPIDHAVCFAHPDNRLDAKLPACMVTPKGLRDWLRATGERHAATRLPVAEMAARIHSHLDYSDAAYERFRSVIDSDGDYTRMLARRDAARQALEAHTQAEAEARQQRPDRAGFLPRWMFRLSLGMSALALVLAATGPVGTALAWGLGLPVRVAFAWLPERPVDGVQPAAKSTPAPTGSTAKAQRAASR